MTFSRRPTGTSSFAVAGSDLLAVDGPGDLVFDVLADRAGPAEDLDGGQRRTPAVEGVQEIQAAA